MKSYKTDPEKNKNGYTVPAINFFFFCSDCGFLCMVKHVKTIEAVGAVKLA